MYSPSNLSRCKITFLHVLLIKYVKTETLVMLYHESFKLQDNARLQNVYIEARHNKIISKTIMLVTCRIVKF